MTDREICASLGIDVRYAICIQAYSHVTGRGWSGWANHGDEELRLFDLDARDEAEQSAKHTARYAPQLTVHVVPVVLDRRIYPVDADGVDEDGEPVRLIEADQCNELFSPDGEPLLSCLDLAPVG